MKILTIPYIAGGISHLLPLYILEQKYIKKNRLLKNQFLTNKNIHNFLGLQGINCVQMDYTLENQHLLEKDFEQINNSLVAMEKQAYEMTLPDVIIEDTACLTPLIAEKNNIPRISIQRTGVFRAIDKQYRNPNHVHSFQKGSHQNIEDGFANSYTDEAKFFDSTDLKLLEQYPYPKAKIIPGIPSIECLPEDIKNKESFFYSGPLLVQDKPSEQLLIRINHFMANNPDKPIVFITTGTVDKTPIGKYILYFIEKGFAVITTCNDPIINTYPEQILYNKLLPLHYICSISDVMMHQCSASIYHYPIMNAIPSITIGTQCYDREDIAIRLEQLGVSAHIPHPDDNAKYWEIFEVTVEKFMENKLVDKKAMEKLQMEIQSTMDNFDINEVIAYAISN